MFFFVFVVLICIRTRWLFFYVFYTYIWNETQRHPMQTFSLHTKDGHYWYRVQQIFHMYSNRNQQQYKQWSNDSCYVSFRLNVLMRFGSLLFFLYYFVWFWMIHTFWLSVQIILIHKFIISLKWAHFDQLSMLANLEYRLPAMVLYIMQR